MALRVFTLLLTVFLVVGLVPAFALGNGEEELVDPNNIVLEPAEEEDFEKVSGGDETINICAVNFWVEGNLYETVTVEKGLAIEQILIPNPPALEDRYFIEWCDDSSAAFDFGQGVTQDLNIYAVYSEPEAQSPDLLEPEGDATDEADSELKEISLMGAELVEPMAVGLPLELPLNSNWNQTLLNSIANSGLVDLDGADIFGSLISINGQNTLSYIVYNPYAGKLYLYTYSISNQHPVTEITISGTAIESQTQTASWQDTSGHRVFVFDVDGGLPENLLIKGDVMSGHNIDNTGAKLLILNTKREVVVFDGQPHGLPFPATTNSIGVPITIEYRIPGTSVWTNAAPLNLSYTEVGTYTIAVRASALNYSSAMGTITLEIVPREITVKPTDRSKLYDGDELVANAITVALGSAYPLAPGHYLDDSDVTFIGSQTDPGSSDSYISDAKQIIIRNDKGVDVTDGYLVKLAPGTLTVTDTYTVVYEPGLHGTWAASAETYKNLQPGSAIPAFASNNSGHDTAIHHDAGWIFAGWASETGIDHEGVVPSNLTNSTIVFVAQWQPASYEIRYFANGGSGSMSPTVVTFGQSVSLSANEFTRAGYSFVGWSTYFKAARVFYEEQAIFTYGLAGNLFLFALWAEDDDVTISYEAGAGGLVTLSNETLAPATGRALGSTAEADDDYEFVNWTNENDDIVSTDEFYKPPRIGGLNIKATYYANFAEIIAVVETDPDDDPDTGTEEDPTTTTPVVVTTAAPVVTALAVTPAAEVPAVLTPFEQVVASIFGDQVPTAPLLDERVPLAAIGFGAWSLLNLIMIAVGAILAAFMLAVCIRGRFAEKQNERIARRTQSQERSQEKVTNRKMSAVLRVIAALVAIAAIILFILVEDMSLTMVLIDQWSIVFLAILVVQSILWIIASRIRRAKVQTIEEEASIA